MQRLKVGDLVVVISGDEDIKGKRGTITKLLKQPLLKLTAPS